MNLFTRLSELDRPIRCAVVGCGKFATMFLSQARRVHNLDVAVAVDLSLERAESALREAGYANQEILRTREEADNRSGVRVTNDLEMALSDASIDVIIEATGNPIAGTTHALAAIDAGKHVVMVTVEADVLVGPILAQRAREAGVVYSMAYGDQPALVCELVDWARTTGFEVVAAGKGTKFLPEYVYSTPETVWGHYGFTPEYANTAHLNPQMFNSFLDGTKSAIEMAAISNATLLIPPAGGLSFPPCGADDLASICVPRSNGGVLEQSGTVEVVSSLHRDGSPVQRDLRWGVYVTLQAGSDYVADCFEQYGLVTDASGQFTAMYRPHHLIGLELGVSIASAVIRGEATGAPRAFVSDVASTAKRDLHPGETLDGEGGYTLFGSLVASENSIEHGYLPIGLANGAHLVRHVKRGDFVCWNDVSLTQNSDALLLRQQLENAHQKSTEQVLR